MIEAANFWNEPNNKSHWDFEVDPPEEKGIMPHHTSAPQHIGEYAEFCVAMMRRYA